MLSFRTPGISINSSAITCLWPNATRTSSRSAGVLESCHLAVHRWNRGADCLRERGHGIGLQHDPRQEAPCSRLSKIARSGGVEVLISLIPSLVKSKFSGRSWDGYAARRRRSLGSTRGYSARCPIASTGHRSRGPNSPRGVGVQMVSRWCPATRRGRAAGGLTARLDREG